VTLAAIGAETAALLAAAVRFVGRWRRRYLLVLAATAAVTAVVYPYDGILLQRLRSADPALQSAAIWLSSIGRFENSSLAFAVALAALGLLLRRPRLRVAAVACLLAGLVAGIGVNLLRPTFGRARPHAAVQPGFYWFEMRPELHSMPSGHATSNAASAAAIATVVPVLTPLAVLYAGGVAWSRMQLNRHYPTDVIWGLVLGGSVGLAIGAAARDRRGSPRPASRDTGPTDRSRSSARS